MLLGCTAEESNDDIGIGSTSLRTNWDRFGPLLDDETRLLISSEIVAEENLRERLEGLVDPARAHRYPFQATNWCDYLRVRDEDNARKIRLDIDDLENQMVVRSRSIDDPIERESFVRGATVRLERLREELGRLERRRKALQHCLRHLASVTPQK